MQFDGPAFLTAYAEMFEAMDGARVSALYHTPFTTVRADGRAFTLRSETDARDFFTDVIDSYREEGMSRFALNDVEGRDLGSAGAVLSCTWQMLRADGTTIRDWRQSYVMGHFDYRWWIMTSIFHV